MLIELLEESPNLWDVFNKDYSKRNVKHTAYKEIKTDVFGCNIASIKGKINGLRPQYGSEIAKANKTKSGQCAGKLYVSIWIQYQSMTFLQPVTKSSGSKNTLKQSNEDLQSFS